MWKYTRGNRRRLGAKEGWRPFTSLHPIPGGRLVASFQEVGCLVLNPTPAFFICETLLSICFSFGHADGQPI